MGVTGCAYWYVICQSASHFRGSVFWSQPLAKFSLQITKYSRVLASRSSKKAPDIRGLFERKGSSTALVSKPEVGQIAVTVCDLGIDHQDPINDREKAAEEAAKKVSK